VKIKARRMKKNARLIITRAAVLSPSQPSESQAALTLGKKQANKVTAKIRVEARIEVRCPMLIMEEQ